MGKIIMYSLQYMDKFISFFRILCRSVFFEAYTNNLNQGTKILGQVHVWGCKNLKLGKNVTISPGVMFYGNGNITIGSNVSIGKDTIIISNSAITIGDNVLIAGQSFIVDTDHVFKDRNILIKNQGLSTRPIHIGSDVWIAANVKILKATSIGNGVIIGASSLATGNIEPYSIYAGIPAKKIKKRK